MTTAKPTSIQEAQQDLPYPPARFNGIGYSQACGADALIWHNGMVLH